MYLSRQHFTLSEGPVKHRQTVRLGHVGGVVLRVMNDSVDAEDVLVFDVRGPAAGGQKQIRRLRR
jgi:hypothetical protein